MRALVLLILITTALMAGGHASVDAAPTCSPSIKMDTSPVRSQGTIVAVNVSLQATKLSGGTTNQLTRLAFQSVTNGKVEVNRSPVTIPSTIALSASQASFVLTPADPSQGYLVQFVVSDLCGDLSKLAGYGNTSGSSATSTATATSTSTPIASPTATSTPTSSPTSSATATTVVQADAFVTVDRSKTLGTSRLSTGVVHTTRSLDSWGDATAITRGKALLQASTVFQNQHIMGWGAGNPEPSPGSYNWSDLDRRVTLMRQTGGVMVITLCCAPDWMKGGVAGATDWSTLEVAPLPEHEADFAELARQVALRYPDVQYFQVWNELKGMWNAPLNRWDYERYTRFYNLVYDAVKSANPNAKIGGPYPVMDHVLNKASMSNPSSVSGPYGTLDQRPLDVISYWLANKRGADFITMDGAAWSAKDGVPSDLWGATDAYYRDIAQWLRAQTTLPLWWAEAYPSPGTDPSLHSALGAAMLSSMARNGWATGLLWTPQGGGDMGDKGIWTNTEVTGGGQPYPYYTTSKAYRDNFGSGMALYQTSSSSVDMTALASSTQVLLVNHRGTSMSVSINGAAPVTLAPYEVRVL